MPSSDSAPNTFDTLLRLGDQIGEAVEAGDWSLVSELIERRGELVQQVGGDDGPAAARALSASEREAKLTAFAEQNRRLTELLRERRNEIEKELAQIGDLKHAQNSYEEHSTQSGVLPAELSG